MATVITDERQSSSQAPVDRLSFEDCYSRIETVVDQRKEKWERASTIEWAGVREGLMARLFETWHLYDPIKDPQLETWVNRVVTARLSGLARNVPKVSPVAKPSFEQCYPEIEKIVARRKGSWTYLSIMTWEEVKSTLVVRVWEKWDKYDPTKARKLECWVNTVVTNALLNLRRDLILRWSRPCIGGGKTNGKSCVYNLGGDSCSFTASGTQCAQCPLFAEWEKTRKHQLHIKSNVALEYHAQEVSNVQQDFTDIDAIKKKVDEQMLANLTRWEGMIYRMLFIKNLPAMEVSRQLDIAARKRKGPLKTDELTSYQSVLANQRRFKAMMFEVLKREGYDLQLFLDSADR